MTFLHSLFIFSVIDLYLEEQLHVEQGDQRYGGVWCQHSSLSDYVFESNLPFWATVTWNKILGNVV